MVILRLLLILSRIFQIVCLYRVFKKRRETSTLPLGGIKRIQLSEKIHRLIKLLLIETCGPPVLFYLKKRLKWEKHVE